MSTYDNSPCLAVKPAQAVASSVAARPQTEVGARPNVIVRHRVGAFIVLAFAFSWWPWPLAILKPDSTAMVSFGPIIAAFLVAAVTGGRRQVTGLLKALVRWRVPWPRYAIVLAGPFLIAGAVGALALGFGNVSPASVGDTLDWSTWSSLPLLFAVTALLGGPLFEEVGWRGFLLEELQRRRAVVASTMLLAVVWAVWHLPLLISEPTGQRPPIPFVVWVIGQAVILTWVYNTSRGSVLLVILFHAAANVSGRLLLEPFVGQDGFLALWWLMTAGYTVVAALLVWRTHGLLGRGSSAGQVDPS